VECVDAVLEKVRPENTLDIALLKASKLNALLNIGNCGQIVNLVDNEIMPILDKYFSKKQNSQDLGFMYETWLRTYLILANALIMQGNDRSFEILTILFDIIERNQIKDELFICKCKLTLAFANTIKGNYQASEQMLEEVLKSYRENVMNNETILRWNFINIINNFFKHHYQNMQEDLFQIVTFANNNGDNFTKNILKTLLGKVFKDNGNSKQAMEIYNDQVAYFAKEKMAMGALLTWYLIADTTLNTEGPKNAMEIAEQALEVAQNPKINNYFFTILLKAVIAKCAITNSDFETAKMHLEGAIILARKFNLKDLLSRLYILYGKYFQEIGLTKSAKQIEYLQAAQKLYTQAKELIEQTKNKYVYTDLKKAQSVLRSFCKLHSFDLSNT
jgi:tetratricopeptide (TPR) repeat protein